MLLGHVIYIWVHVHNCVHILACKRGLSWADCLLPREAVEIFCASDRLALLRKKAVPRPAFRGDGEEIGMSRSAVDRRPHQCRTVYDLTNCEYEYGNGSECGCEYEHRSEWKYECDCEVRRIANAKANADLIFTRTIPFFH